MTDESCRSAQFFLVRFSEYVPEHTENQEEVRLSSSPQLFIDLLSVSMYFVVLIHCLLDNLHPRHTILEPLACTK